MTTKAKEDIKFDGSDEKKFGEWVTKTKAIGARKGWVKVLNSLLCF